MLLVSPSGNLGFHTFWEGRGLPSADASSSWTSEAVVSVAGVLLRLLFPLTGVSRGALLGTRALTESRHRRGWLQLGPACSKQWRAAGCPAVLCRECCLVILLFFPSRFLLFFFSSLWSSVLSRVFIDAKNQLAKAFFFS